MRIIDRYNTIVGAIVTIASALLGVYWYLFAGYLLLNVLDWLTGWYKSWKSGQESSKKGLSGIVKKVGYWIIILVAFLIPEMFINFGKDMLGLDLSFLMLFGWFTLASLLVNEIRSIIENFVEMGYNVPPFLMKGLEITDQILKSKTEIE